MTEMQKELLMLLKEFDELCRRNNITYYLLGGSALGAMRHRGSIPWDDDADVFVTRENAEKLINLPQSELPANRAILHEGNNKDQAITNIWYMDTSAAFLFRYHTMYRNSTGVKLDIDILDPAPDDAKGQQQHIEALTAYSEARSTALTYSHRLPKGLPAALKKRQKALSKDKFLNETYRQFTSVDEDESNTYIMRWAAVQHVYKKDMFGTPRYVPFEDTFLPVPQRVEDYLVQSYMDEWINLPPLEDQSLHVCVWNKFIDSQVYFDDFSKLVPTEKAAKLYKNQRKYTHQFGRAYWNIVPVRAAFVGKKLYRELQARLNKTGETLTALVEAKNYARLEELLRGYLQVQCGKDCIGNVTYEGWPLRNNPVLLEQDDTVTYALVRLLLYKGLLSKAGRVLLARKQTERPLSSELEKLDQLIAGIRAATSAYFADQKEKAGELCKTWLSEYDDIPDLIRLRCALQFEKVQQGEVTAEACSASFEAGLAIHHDDEILLYLQTVLTEQAGDTEEADRRYLELAPCMNNGYLLLALQDRMYKRLEADPTDRSAKDIYYKAKRRSGTFEEDIAAIFEKLGVAAEEEIPAAEQETVTEPQAEQQLQDTEAAPEEGTPESITFRLLQEIDTICRKNHIQYFLGGSTALAAYRDEHALPRDFVSAVVLMTAENCKKFMAAYEKAPIPGRCLDSMRDNPEFPGFFLRYTHEDSLYFPASTYQCYKSLGIPVVIHVLRGNGKSKWTRKALSLMELCWESKARMPYHTPRRAAGAAAARLGGALVGKKRLSGWLFNALMKDAGRGIGNQYRVRFPWKGSVIYALPWFKRGTKVTLYGQAFSIPADAEHYFGKLYGKNWQEKKPEGSKDAIEAMFSSILPWREFTGFFEKETIAQFPAQYKAYKKTLGMLQNQNRELAHYWDIIMRTHDRFLLSMYYLPLKKRILEWYHDGNYEELYACLDPYLKGIRRNANCNLSLNFDKQLFNIAMNVLVEKNEAGLAAKVRRLESKEKQPFTGLKLPQDQAAAAQRFAANELNVTIPQ